jgi:hypothetical protein
MRPVPTGSGASFAVKDRKGVSVVVHNDKADISGA